MAKDYPPGYKTYVELKAMLEAHKNVIFRVSFMDESEVWTQEAHVTGRVLEGNKVEVEIVESRQSQEPGTVG